MRNTLQTAVLVVVIASTPCSRAAAQETFAVSDVNVVDVRTGRIQANQTVVVEDGRIRAIEAGAQVPSGATRIDGTGKYLIPGLWDMHVHMRHPAAPEILFPQFIANGVTGVRDMSSDCDNPDEDTFCIENMRAWQAEIDAGTLLGPRILALSSTPVNPPWDWEGTEQEVREVIRRFDARGVDLIKMYFRTSPEVFGWIMDEAQTLGMDVGGHIPLRLTVTAASNLGLRSLEHARDFLFDCFPGSAEFRSTARSQNPPMDVMRSMVDDHDVTVCAEVFQTLVSNDTWYVPTHVTRRMDAYADDPVFRADPRSKYLPAAAWQAWQEDADRMVALDSTPEGRRVMRGFYERGLEITKRAHSAGVPIALGTDAGDTYVFPGSSVHDELGEFVKAGLTPAQALAAATVRSAEFMRVEADFGAIEVGKYADMVLLNANPLRNISNTRNIDMVFITGHLLTRADLQRMLTAVEAAVLRF